MSAFTPYIPSSHRSSSASRPRSRLSIPFPGETYLHWLSLQDYFNGVDNHPAITYRLYAGSPQRVKHTYFTPAGTFQWEFRLLRDEKIRVVWVFRDGALNSRFLEVKKGATLTVSDAYLIHAHLSTFVASQGKTT